MRAVAERALGLDVGTSAVRVVEVSLEPRPVVRVFGQVALPPGAARDGEVVDPAAVGEAIARLWREQGLRRRDVRMGLASQRVVVRTVELPAMPDAELEGAVRFSAQDHIPIPLEEAALDFTVLERFTGTLDGAPMVRVLVAAAHREPLDRLLQAVAAGGLRAVGVDLVPFALVRALAGEPAALGKEPADPLPAPEAIVSVGAGVTTVVVHEAGRPRFVRTVATGGQALTAAVAEELGVSPEAAEAAKCSAPPHDPDHGDTPRPGELAARAARVVEARLAGILGEIQGSLNYWMAQSDRPLGRVLLTGGGALAGDLPGRLGLLLGVPVEMARPRDRLDVEAEREADPFLPAAAGLALGAAHVQGRRIDLSPFRPRPGLASRRVVVGMAAAAAGLVLVLGGLGAARVVGLGRERARLAAQERENRRLEAEIDRLDELRRVSSELDAGRHRLLAALAGDVAWTRMLEDLAHSLPEDVWLTAFNAQLGPPAAPGAPGSGLGTVSFTAVGLDFPAVAAWLERVPEQPAFAGVAIGSASKSNLGPRSVVNFSSTAQLAPAARSDRGERLLNKEDGR